MSNNERRIQPDKPQTTSQKVRSLLTGKETYPRGEESLYSQDWVRPYVAPADKVPDLNLSDPLAFARRMDRFFKADHEKLDSLDNIDELWHEMGQDSLISASLGHIDDAMTAAPMTIQVDEKYRSFCEYVTREAAALTSDTRQRALDSYARGFVLGELRLERMERGPFKGLHTIAEIRRLERDSYELIEDQFSRPSQLQIDVSPQRRDALEGTKRGRRQGWASPTYKASRSIVLTPDDPEWQRYLFLTWPARSNRLAGVAALGAAWPWYYFASHLRQWMMTLGERLGNPILVAEFKGIETPRPGAGYAQTREEVFATLEAIQTNFRGLLPEGYTLSSVSDGAEGKAQLLTTLFDTSVRMIQLAIERQVVAGGLEAQGGTLGANQTVFSGTFGGLIAAQNRRQAGILAQLLEMLILVNFGEQTDVDITYAFIDPAQEDRERATVSEAIGLGIVKPFEPWLRTLFKAPPLDEELLLKTREEAQRRTDFGLDSGEAAPQATSTEEVSKIIESYLTGTFSIRLGSHLLADAMGVPTDEAALILEEEAARRTAPSLPTEPEPETAVEPTLATQAMKRAAAIGLELAGTHGDLAVSERAMTVARILVGGKPVTMGMRERIAAWHDLNDSVNIEGDLDNPSVKWIEYLLHGGDTARPWSNPDEFMAESVMISCARMRKAILGLSEKVKSPDYDATRPPPCRRGIERAVGRLYRNPADTLRISSEIREGVKVQLETGLPSCDSEDTRLALLEGIADHYSDPTRFLSYGS